MAWSNVADDVGTIEIDGSGRAGQEISISGMAGADYELLGMFRVDDVVGGGEWFNTVIDVDGHTMALRVRSDSNEFGVGQNPDGSFPHGASTSNIWIRGTTGRGLAGYSGTLFDDFRRVTKYYHVPPLPPPVEQVWSDADAVNSDPRAQWPAASLGMTPGGYRWPRIYQGFGSNQYRPTGLPPPNQSVAGEPPLGCDGSVFYIALGEGVSNAATGLMNAFNYNATVPGRGDGTDPWDVDVFIMRARFRTVGRSAGSGEVGAYFQLILGSVWGISVNMTNVPGDGGLCHIGSGPFFSKTDWVANEWYVVEWKHDTIAGFDYQRIFLEGHAPGPWIQSGFSGPGNRLGPPRGTYGLYMLTDAFGSTGLWRFEVGGIWVIPSPGWMRFRMQVESGKAYRAKVWPLGASEPSCWYGEVSDPHPRGVPQNLRVIISGQLGGASQSQFDDFFIRDLTDTGSLDYGWGCESPVHVSGRTFSTTRAFGAGTLAVYVDGKRLREGPDWWAEWVPGMETYQKFTIADNIVFAQTHGTCGEEVGMNINVCYLPTRDLTNARGSSPKNLKLNTDANKIEMFDIRGK